MKRHLRIVLFLLIAVASCGRSSAQTLWPVVAEFQAKNDLNAVSSGQVTLRNDGLFPMVTTVEALSFDVSQGRTVLRPLSADIQIEWETTSAKIAPKQEYTFYYRATVKKAPAWFVIEATMTGPRPHVVVDPGNPRLATGVVLSMRLPSVVYVYGHTSVKSGDISLSWAGSNLDLQNLSVQCARASGLEAHMPDGTVKKFGGFPIFPNGIPGSGRTFKFNQKPAYVVIHFRGFSIDTRKIS